MIGRLLGAMAVVLLGAMATSAALVLMHSYTEPIGGLCQTARVGGPTLALGGALLILIVPPLLRRRRVPFLSGGRVLLASLTLAVALPLTTIGLVVSGALATGDPFAGQPLPLTDASLITDLAEPLELRFQGKVGQVFTTVQSREISSTWAVGACDRRPATLVHSFRQIVEQTVERVSASGTATIRQSWPQVEMRAVHNGETQFQADSAMPSEEGEEIDLLSVNLRAELFPNGGLRILAVEGEGTGVERVRSVMEWAETQDASMLPDAPVRPGDTWRLGQRRFAIPSGGNVSYTPEATFRGVATQSGRQVAVIDLTARDIEVATDTDRKLVTDVRRFAIKGRVGWNLALGRPLSDTTLIEFAGLGHAPDRGEFLLRVQAKLQAVEEP
jgi:hypothetical protein